MELGKRGIEGGQATPTGSHCGSLHEQSLVDRLLAEQAYHIKRAQELSEAIRELKANPAIEKVINTITRG